MMEKEALQYVAEKLAEPTITEVNGEMYSDKVLERISFNPKAYPIQMSTLTGLLDYIESRVDDFKYDVLVHVVSPTEVDLISALDDERRRESFVVTEAKIPQFPFGKFIDHESFCIHMQSKFKDSEDRSLVLKFAGTVEDGTVAEYGDNGVTQKATVKTGLTSKGEAKVPNPVKLRPYRTFTEVEQPESEFIFRMRSFDGVECAVFEADGGAWEREAMKNISEYLKEELEEYKNITVIS